MRWRRLRYADWQARMQPLAGRLEEYRDQHLTCTDGDGKPGPYIVVRIEDKAAGIGNELPGVITGTVFTASDDSHTLWSSHGDDPVARSLSYLRICMTRPVCCET